MKLKTGNRDLKNACSLKRSKHWWASSKAKIKKREDTNY
jgi:hypothetical protein